MKLLYRRCAGLDVHQKSINVWVRIRRSGQPLQIHEAEFATFTRDLERLRDCLKQHKVKQVAMESAMESGAMGIRGCTGFRYGTFWSR
jgi:transposase